MSCTVEINSIDTSYMCLIVRALRESGMKQLAEIFMLWSFEEDWDPIAEFAIELVEKILQKTCNSYQIKINDTELTWTKEAEEEEEEIADL